MRTTIDLADDVLIAAKEAARRDRKTLGQVVSELARQALTAPGASGRAPTSAKRLARFGIEPLPGKAGVVTNELIDRLR